MSFGISSRSSSSEARGLLVLPFTDLTRDDEHVNDRYYATADEAFLSQTIFSYVYDEVHGMLQILFCEKRYCTSFFNPIYLVLLAVLYILTFPGALLHYMLLPIIPVRKIENPEERELRSQGLYTAIGIAIWSIPFDAVGIVIGTDVMKLVNKISIAVNAAIILYNLAGLKAMAEEMAISMKTFAVGTLLILLFLIGLAVFDVYNYFTVSFISAIEYSLRLIEIIVFSIICFQVFGLWSIYSKSKASMKEDICYTCILCVLLAIIAAGFLVAVIISEDEAWRVV